MNFNCSNSSSLRSLQEQVKKAFCYQKLFWPFTVWINCSTDLKNFASSRPLASNFKSFSRSLEQFFLTVGQNNFGNKIPFFLIHSQSLYLTASFHQVWLKPNYQVTRTGKITECFGFLFRKKKRPSCYYLVFGHPFIKMKWSGQLWILLSVTVLLEMRQCKTFRKLQVGYKTITTFYSGFPL